MSGNEEREILRTLVCPYCSTQGYMGEIYEFSAFFIANSETGSALAFINSKEQLEKYGGFYKEIIELLESLESVTENFNNIECSMCAKKIPKDHWVYEYFQLLMRREKYCSLKDILRR